MILNQLNKFLPQPICDKILIDVEINEILENNIKNINNVNQINKNRIKNIISYLKICNNLIIKTLKNNFYFFLKLYPTKLGKNMSINVEHIYLNSNNDYFESDEKFDLYMLNKKKNKMIVTLNLCLGFYADGDKDRYKRSESYIDRIERDEWTEVFDKFIRQTYKMFDIVIYENLSIYRYDIGCTHNIIQYSILIP